MTAPKYRNATFYVQFEPHRGSAWATAVRLTQRKPPYPLGGTVMVKLTVDIPASAFEPLNLAAAVAVDEGEALATVAAISLPVERDTPEEAES